MTTSINWPAGLPYAAQMGSWRIAERHGPNVFSQMNAGTTRARRKFSLRVARMRFDIAFTASQLATFIDFYNDDLGDGAARFNMSVWDGGAYVTRVCKFAAAPEYSEYAHLMTKVTFDLLVESL